MNIVEHRPPLKRIDFAPKPRPAEQPIIDLDCIAKFTEQERIWQLVKQSAQGCNPAGEQA